MRTGKSRKRWRAAFLAAGLWPVLALCPAQAKEEGLPGMGSLRVSVEENALVYQNGDGSYAEDLKTAELTVDLYRVAQMPDPQVGAYVPLPGMEELETKEADSGLDDVGAETTAQEWQALAKKATEILGLPYEQEGAQKEPPSGRLAPLSQTGRASEEMIFSGLADGLYLVYARYTETADYGYEFTPYLVSVPNNEYYVAGSAGYGQSGADRWQYDVAVGLKPRREELYGSLRIVKSLPVYNAALGDATFVLRVRAIKDGAEVYNNVVSLKFDAPGQKEARVERLPVGAQVFVEEVETGAYRLKSMEPADGCVTILKDGAQGAPVTVSLLNEPTGEHRYGTSVTNHFGRSATDRGFEPWEQREDSSSPDAEGGAQP